MKVEIDPEEAFKAVIEELESDRRYLQWRNTEKLVCDGVVDKLKAILSAGSSDYRGEAQAISELLKSDDHFVQYLEMYGIKVDITKEKV